MAEHPGTGRAAEDELRAMREHERDKRTVEAPAEDEAADRGSGGPAGDDSEAPGHVVTLGVFAPAPSGKSR